MHGWCSGNIIAAQEQSSCVLWSLFGGDGSVLPLAYNLRLRPHCGGCRASNSSSGISIELVALTRPLGQPIRGRVNFFLGLMSSADIRPTSWRQQVLRLLPLVIVRREQATELRHSSITWWLRWHDPGPASFNRREEAKLLAKPAWVSRLSQDKRKGWHDHCKKGNTYPRLSGREIWWLSSCRWAREGIRVEDGGLDGSLSRRWSARRSSWWQKRRCRHKKGEASLKAL